jgi:hypothetical protein
MTQCMILHTSVTNLAPCVPLRYPLQRMRHWYCDTCNRWFLSETCFQNDLILKMKVKLICQWRQVCRNCTCLVTSDSKHECIKKFAINLTRNLPAIYATWLDRSLASFLRSIYKSSSTRSAHKTSKSAKSNLSLFRTSYVLSKCVLNV